MPDDPTDELQQLLSSLYGDASKHSGYQTMPDFVAERLGFQSEIDQRWRGDRVRLDYIRRVIRDDPPSWCDFGANTGFFSLSLAEASRGTEVLAVEANPRHAELIERVAAACRLPNLRVLSRSIGIRELDELGRVDVLLHMNVLHHAGVDFDTDVVGGPGDFQDYAIRYLTRVAAISDRLVFQAGVNLGGDKSRPILERADHVTRTRYWSDLLRAAGWRVLDCALARSESNGSVAYLSVPARLLELLGSPRDEPGAVMAEWFAGLGLDRHPGEFFLRPIFYCAAGMDR